ncbi:MAG: hypothetical protein COB56_00990 [Robiginitomaculum sp.]|nr:MAG: hypothetical protein COB56_00990 [Robiginitomaculum sp.]
MGRAGVRTNHLATGHHSPHFSFAKLQQKRGFRIKDFSYGKENEASLLKMFDISAYGTDLGLGYGELQS